MTRARPIVFLAWLAAGSLWSCDAADSARPDVSTEKVVQLPPFLVQADQVTPWRYGEFDSVQVLSSCDETVTTGFVRRYRRAEAEFAELVPDEFRSNVPELLILVPPAHAKSIAKEMSQLMTAVSGSAQTISHLRVSDADSFATYFIVDPEARSEAPSDRPRAEFPRWLESLAGARQPDYLRFTLSVDYITDRLASRRPALPPCIVSGLADTFEAALETEHGMYSQPDSWLTQDDWRAVRFDTEAPRPLLPVTELLRGAPGLDKDARYRRLWRAEAELFVRWALFSGSSERAAAFWRFVRETAGRSPTEQRFQSCFGIDYADCRDALSDALPAATRNAVAWAMPVPRAPRLWFRAARLEEVDACKGEWNRMILAAIERDFPHLLQHYREQALTVFTRALDRGERSARLLGSLGLLQVELGNDGAARETLEAAVAAGAKRPLVLIELARLRLAHALSAKTTSDPKLTPAEAAAVLALLDGVLQSPQPLQGAYRVARETLHHLDRPPTSEERRLLETASAFSGEN